MIPTTFRGEDVYLLYQRPDWKTPPVVRFTALAAITAGLTGVEERPPLAASHRVRFEFGLFLFDDESAEFRVALQRQSAENKRILCPFWPGATNYYSGGAVYTSPEGEFYEATGSGEIYVSSTGEGCWLPTGVWLTFEEDFSQWEIHETDTPETFEPSETAIRVPLMYGIFESAPDPDAPTSKLLTVPIRFRDTGTADIALRSVELAFEDGPSVAGATPKVFPLLADWSRSIKAGGAVVEIEREEIGFGRTPSESYYPQPSRRLIEMGYTPTDWEEIAQLVAFFYQRQGIVESFWIEGACDELTLTATTSDVSAVVAVRRAADLGDNRYIVLESGENRVLRKVLSVDLGTNEIVLDSAPGIFSVHSTRIYSLLLVRYARPELSVTFRTDRIAEATIGFIETPSEYFVPSGETPGTTSGAIARKGWGFRFYQVFPEVTKYWRFTSYERDVVVSGETFIGNLGWSHSSITDSLDPAECVAAITARAHEDNPLMQFLPFRLEAPLYCDIVEFSPNDSGVASSATTVFTGTVTRPRFNGPIITVEVRHLLQNLIQPVPTKLFQPTCNWKVYGGPCGVSEGDFTFTGDYVSDDGNTITLDSIARLVGSVPTLSDGYFARGRVWFGSGENYQSRAIYNSLADGGELTLTLSRPFNPQPPGSVNFSPGCDGRKSTCQAKFDNYVRFGGYPFIPAASPSLKAIKTETPAGGKK